MSCESNEESMFALYGKRNAEKITRALCFGPSPMIAVMPELKRLRAAEDAHNRRWHPAMVRVFGNAE